MDGPAHYIEAEKCLLGTGSINDGPSVRQVEMAKIHAILALTAATVGPLTDELGFATPAALGWPEALQ